MGKGEKLARDTEIILDDPFVLHLIDRARQKGYFDGFTDTEPHAFFEDTSKMSRWGRALYTESCVENAIGHAYREGRELGQEIGESLELEDSQDIRYAGD